MWNDPRIGINWPIDNPILSDRDKYQPRDKDKKYVDFYENYNKLIK